MNSAAETDPFDIEDNPDDDDESEFPRDDEEGTEEEEHEGRGEEEAAEKPDAETEELRKEVIALRRQHEQALAEQKERDLEAERVKSFEVEKAKLVSELDAKGEELLKKRRTAFDDGDMDAFDGLDEELFQIRSARMSAGEARKPRGDAGGAASETPVDDITDAAKAWLTLHPEFHSDDEFKRKVLKVNGELIKEQYKPDDPRMYQELDRRLSGGDAPTKPKKTGAVAGVNRGNARGTKTTSQKRITEADKRKMTKYGLDKDNPEHRRAWLNRDKQL